MWKLLVYFGLTCALFGVSFVAAQNTRYLNLHHATHLSGGWVAFSNGSLYECVYDANDEAEEPQCREATGIPANMQKVTALWGAPGQAWVAYSDGHVYACSSPSEVTRYQRPNCKVARGVP